MKKIRSFLFFYLLIPFLVLANPLLILNEGFLKHTLIKTLKGYTAIQDLNKKSVIAALGKDGKVCEQEVWNNQKFWIESYVKIYSGENKLVMGVHQKLYLPQEGRWINAQDAIPGQRLAPNFIVDRTEIINEPVEIYALTTSLHHFHVSKYDVIAHNMSAGASIASVAIGEIIAASPVPTLLGATLSLSTVVINYFSDSIDQLGQMLVPGKTQEALYYNNRRQELEQLRDHFVSIINDLKGLKDLKNPSYLTHNYLNSIKHDAPRVPVDESRFNRRQFKALQQARDVHLNSLEQEIFELNITLCSHLNELIELRDAAELEVKQSLEALTQLKGADAFWAIPERAQIYCESIGRLEQALKDLQKCNEELRRVCHYYSNTEHASIVKKCSNLPSILDEEYSNMEKQATLIKQAKREFQKINRDAQKFYTKHKIDIKGLQKQLKINNRKASRIELKRRIKDATNRRDEVKASEIDRKVQKHAQGDEQASAAGGGGMPPEDPWGNNQSGGGQDKRHKDNEKPKINIFEKNLKHIFRNAAGHLRDTPSNRKLLVETASNLKNFLGKDRFGNEWFSKIMPDGRQIWVSVRNNIIRNGGVNSIHRSFNSETGLCCR